MPLIGESREYWQEMRAKAQKPRRKPLDHVAGRDPELWIVGLLWVILLALIVVLWLWPGIAQH